MLKSLAFFFLLSETFGHGNSIRNHDFSHVEHFPFCFYPTKAYFSGRSIAAATNRLHAQDQAAKDKGTRQVFLDVHFENLAGMGFKPVHCKTGDGSSLEPSAFEGLLAEDFKTKRKGWKTADPTRAY
jgi:hypothetical protein